MSLICRKRKPLQFLGNDCGFVQSEIKLALFSNFVKCVRGEVNWTHERLGGGD